MSSTTNYVGIDIAKKTFVAAIFCPQKKKYMPTEWDYMTPASIATFIDSLPAEAHCVMEATGVYHLRLAAALLERGLKCSVVNPLAVKRFAQMRQSITKNDAQDARMIAQYALSESPPNFELPEETLAKLSQRRTLLNQLEKQVQSLDNQGEAFEMNPQKDDLTIENLGAIKTFLLGKIADLKTAIRALIEQDFPADVQRLKTIPGFGEVVAQLFVETARSFQGFDEEGNAKAFTKFVGLAPTCHRSGTSVRGAAHINRSGAPTLRAKLYLPALSVAIRAKKDNPFKTTYQRLRQAGKTAKEAIIAVMHKMVRIACAVLRRQQDYSLDIYGKKQPTNINLG